MIDFFFSFKILVAKYALIRFHFKLIILIFEIHYLVKFEKMIQFRFFFIITETTNAYINSVPL